MRRSRAELIAQPRRLDQRALIILGKQTKRIIPVRQEIISALRWRTTKRAHRIEPCIYFK